MCNDNYPYNGWLLINTDAPIPVEYYRYGRLHVLFSSAWEQLNETKTETLFSSGRDIVASNKERKSCYNGRQLIPTEPLVHYYPLP